MIVANLERPVTPGSTPAGERKPRNYNAATLEFIPAPPSSHLFLKLMFLIQLKYFSPVSSPGFSSRLKPFN